MTGKKFPRLSGTREGCGNSAIGDNTPADATLDRIVHNSHRFEMGGESMRELMAEAEKPTSRREETAGDLQGEKNGLFIVV